MDYSSMTFEKIMERMLEKVPDTMDKREGSIIYDALAPAAIELALLYMEFGFIESESYADTATRDYLIKRAIERGITPYEPTNAIVKGVFTPSSLEIPIGSRFNADDLNFEVIEKIADGEYKLECETIGSDGNIYSANLIPIDYIYGLETANITEVLIPGEDEEETESIRKRYFNTFDTKAFGGNIKDYIQKTNAISGVGATKVTPIWNGGGTVLLTILNSEYEKASQTLIDKVQEEIDPTQDGSGLGLAPIGHIVTVRSVNEVVINITANFTFNEGYSFNSLKEEMKKVIDKYFSEIRFMWASENTSIIRISQIETRLLKIEGVLDIGDTAINGVQSNFILNSTEIPVTGELSDE